MGTGLGERMPLDQIPLPVPAPPLRTPLLGYPWPGTGTSRGSGTHRPSAGAASTGDGGGAHRLDLPYPRISPEPAPSDESPVPAHRGPRAGTRPRGRRWRPAPPARGDMGWARGRALGVFREGGSPFGPLPCILPRRTPRLPPPGGEQRVLMASKLNIFGVKRESVRADRGAQFSAEFFTHLNL